MDVINWILDHAASIATVLALLGAVVFPALSRIAKMFGDGPRATAASKFFDGLGLDLAKSGRALASLKSPPSAKGSDDLPKDDEDTDAFVRRTETKP